MLLLNRLFVGLAGVRAGGLHGSRALFGKRKKEKDELDETDKELEDDRYGPLDEDDEEEIGIGDEEDREVADIDAYGEEGYLVNPRFIKRSSELYKKFLESQERPILTKDGYQFNVGLILHRLPLFLAYDSDMVKTFKQKYELIRRTEYYNTAPQEFSENTGSPQLEYERISGDNMITHQRGSGKNREIYAEHSKYWQFVDPNEQDPRSIQFKPCEFLFLLVRNEAGEWVFPDWMVRYKESFDTIRKGIAQDITGNPTSTLFWLADLPIFVHKRDIEGMERGKGIKTFYFNAVHINGRLEKDPAKRTLWKDYRWAPKGELATLMQPDYFQKVIRSAIAPL